MDISQQSSAGVQELIDKIRDKGVQAGRQEADHLIEEAREKAASILTEAEDKANSMISTATAKIESERASANEALQLAARDALLNLKTEITSNFSDRMRRMVSMEMRDHDFLKQLILEVARRVKPEDIDEHPLEINLLNKVVGMDELRNNPEETKEGTLAHLVLAVSGEMLRDGVVVNCIEGSTEGLQVKLTDTDLELNMSDKAITELLLQHLLPRFRALMDGIVR